MALFTNQATLNFNGEIVNSNVAVGSIREILSASKTAVSPSYGTDRGSKVTFAVTVINSGTSPVTGVTVTDDLGGYLFGDGQVFPFDYVEGSAKLFQNGTAAASPAAAGGPPLVFSGITVPAEGNAVLVYEVLTTGYAPIGNEATVTNTVTVTGAGIVSGVTASATVGADASPSLTVEKTVSPVPVSENGSLTYSFTVKNGGTAAVTAADTLTLTDTFDPLLRNVTVTLDGTALTEGTDYSYDTASGLLTVNAGVITVDGAAFTQNAATGEWSKTPGTALLTVTGDL